MTASLQIVSGSASVSGAIDGGNYGLSAVGIASGGTVQAEILGIDDGTWIAAGLCTLSSGGTGLATVELPPGQAGIKVNERRLGNICGADADPLPKRQHIRQTERTQNSRPS